MRGRHPKPNSQIRKKLTFTFSFWKTLLNDKTKSRSCQHRLQKHNYACCQLMCTLFSNAYYSRQVKVGVVRGVVPYQQVNTFGAMQENGHLQCVFFLSFREGIQFNSFFLLAHRLCLTDSCKLILEDMLK